MLDRIPDNPQGEQKTEFIDSFQEPAAPVLTRLHTLLIDKPEVISFRKSFDPGTPLTPNTLSEQYLDTLSLVVQEGSLTTVVDGREYEFPTSYMVLSPRDALLQAGQDRSLVAGPKGATLIGIDKEYLRSLLRNDLQLCDLVREQIHNLFPAERTPSATRRSIRVARDESILSFASRESVKLVNGPEGLLSILNPENVTIQDRDPIGGRDRLVTPAEQIMQLVSSVAPLIGYLPPHELADIAKSAHSVSQSLPHLIESGRAQVALTCFHEVLRGVASELFAKLMPTLASSIQHHHVDPQGEEYRTISNRVLQVRLLETQVFGYASSNVSLEKELLDCIEPVEDHAAIHHRIFKVLDAKIEELFNTAHDNKMGGEDGSLFSVKVTKYPLELRTESNPGEPLPEYHRNYKSMHALEERLRTGDISAVGGKKYAEMRFTEAPLEQLVTSDMRAIMYDGSHENGIAYARRKYGRHEVDSSLLQKCTVVDLLAPYGAFKKSILFFRDGTSVFLVSHTGSGRQISNASALMLYENDEDKRRIPTNKIVLAKDKLDITKRVQHLVDDTLLKETQRLKKQGSSLVAPETVMDIPTVPMILQSPEQFRHALERSGQEFEWNTHKVDSLHSLNIVYIRDKETNSLRRLVIAPVGSRGVYGDTVKHFIMALAKSPHVSNFIPHIIFTGTAGGFNGTNSVQEFISRNIRGLPQNFEKARFIMPEKGIEDMDHMVPLNTLRSLLPADSELEKLFEKMNLFETDFHYCIDAPALETLKLIMEIIDKGHASIDIEGIWGALAVQELRAMGYQATFSPIYFWSDDPRAGAENIIDSLAFGGFLAEGSHPTPELYDALLKLSEIATKAPSFLK